MAKIKEDHIPKFKPEVKKIGETRKPYSNGAYDEKYIEAFCNNPGLGKASALREAGYVGDYLRQEAWRIHNRLREKIEKRLDEAILDGAHLGHSVLVHLCQNSESDTVRAKAAKDLIDYSGRKAGETITVKSEKTDEELDAEIALLQKEIAEQSGRRLDS